MRFNHEISPTNSAEKDKDKDMDGVNSSFCIDGALPAQIQQKIIVGYALTLKKTKSFMQPKLQVLARKKGILFVAIDQNRPLSDQGPFDIILHKLSGKQWRQILEDYGQSHPEITVLDPPGAIQHLHNRQSMLQDVADMNLHGKVGVPRQLVIRDSSSIPVEVTKAGLKLPLVAKPLVVDGSSKSHQLSLAYDRFSLSKLDPPMVLQEFVNHGGVLFKVFIVGETIKVVRRSSLPNVSECELLNNFGLYQFPRVSSATTSADDAGLDPSVAELPPLPLLERLARELRHRLGLQLFNMDIIREFGSKDRFYVIDINYFPGYGKMPEYENIFTDFLLSLAQSKYGKHPAPYWLSYKNWSVALDGSPNHLLFVPRVVNVSNTVSMVQQIPDPRSMEQDFNSDDLDIIQMRLGVPEDTAVWSKTFKEPVLCTWPASVWRWMKKALENIHQEKNHRLLEFVASQKWRSKR
ncbi:hypothetical protein AAC387_Pa02g3259 [Persea americana]